MEVIEISILDPKVKKILDNLEDLDLIQISKPYKLTVDQKKNIKSGRKEIKEGKFKAHKEVMNGLEKWVSGK